MSHRWSLSNNGCKRKGGALVRVNKYMEPWTHTWPDWIRTNDGSLVRTPKMVERIVTCVNACAGIPHPERLPELVEAVTELCKAHDEYAGVVNSSQAPFPHHARCVAKIAAAEKRVMMARRAMMGESE